MSTDATTRTAIGAAAFAAALIGTVAASAFPRKGLVHGAVPSVVNIYGTWSDDEAIAGRHYYRHRHHEANVDAPFTHVETRRRVIVDAPFAHVAVGSYGRHVVAPFVDIWVPR